MWQKQYVGIFMRWCSGYLTDLELVAFLKRASQFLNGTSVKTTRKQGPASFIFVLDNVLEEGEKPFKLLGQRLRHRKTFEELFKQAKLLVYKTTVEAVIHTKFRKVVMWALI